MAIDNSDARNASADFTKLHAIKNQQWKALEKMVDAQPGEKILDCMGGQGQAAEKILNHQPEAVLFVQDRVREAIKKAKNNLNVSHNNLVVGDACKMPFVDAEFDTVVVKMGVHELPKLQQVTLFKELFRVLKPDGKLVLWHIFLDDKLQLTFQAIVRKKDELGGFTHQVKNRYFPTDAETRSNLQTAGFQNPDEPYKFTHTFDLSKRRNELGGDKKKLKELQDFVRQNFPDELKDEYVYEEICQNISFQIQMAIYSIKKAN